MDETDSPERAALRETVRDFCRQHTGATAWKRLSGELGLAALAIDERYDGMGAGIAEVAIPAQEVARVLLPVPYLSTALAGAVLTGAVLAGGDPDAAALFLPDLA